MKIAGKDILIEIYKAGSWVGYACAISADLDVVTDLLETSERGSGYFKTFVTAKLSFTGSLTGFTSLDNGVNLSLYELRKLQLERTTLRLMYNRSAGAFNYTDEGIFWITDSQDTSPYIGFSTFSIALQGTGPLNSSPVPVTPTLIPYDYKYGWVYIDTSTSVSPNVKWAAIKSGIQTAIDNNLYTTATSSDVLADIQIDYSNTGFWVMFLVFPNSITDFNFWTELDNPFQQNVPLVDGFAPGVWSRDTIAAGKLIATEYLTAFTNPIKFSR